MPRLAVLLFAAIGMLRAQPSDPARGLRKSHPRLIVLDADLERIRRLTGSDEKARSMHKRLAGEARRIQLAPPVQYELVNGRILHLSRACLERVYTLALLYRLDRKREYFERALKELRAAAAFPNWNTNFLDKAEMTHAVAIGYDWLYPDLSPDDRTLLRKAIAEKGVRDAIPIYEEKRWWAVNLLNWNPVCNGGVGLGALAIAEDEPELARTVLRYMLRSFPLALSSYTPDGAWVEGPEYWDYATRYAVCLLAGLQSALGHDFKLSSTSGFGATGRFRVYATGPSGKLFNYADCDEEPEGAPELFWLARRFRAPVCAWRQARQLEQSKPGALDLAWYEPAQASPDQAKWPLHAYFRAAEVAMLRSSWDDPEAVFVGVKGGANRGGRGHAHLDLGSFVLDAGGMRWAVDLGRNSYDVPDYFGKLRWTYYRTKTESHNTLQIDGADQDAFAKAPIIRHRFGRDFAWVCLDLSNSWVLRAEVLTPPGAVFGTVSTQVSPPQTPNGDTRKLVVRLPGRTADLRLTVVLTPVRGDRPAAELRWRERALARW
ncbi:MAG: heparinase II/III family protein [Bryobacteraceae bacterium]